MELISGVCSHCGLRRLTQENGRCLSCNSEKPAPDYFGDVAAFHEKYGQPQATGPSILSHDHARFRIGFHREETDEYADEQAIIEDEMSVPIFDRQERKIVAALANQLDALVDSAWVILGTADAQFGRAAFDEAWRRVAAANMTKVRAEASGDDRSKRDAKFDVVKPADFVPPDHRDLVAGYTYDEG